MMKHVIYWDRNIIFIHHLRKAWLKESITHYLKDRIESFDDYWISYIISIEDSNGDSSSHDYYDIPEVY